jgi:hypothetical protein
MTESPSSKRESRIFTVLLLIGFPAGLFVAMALSRAGNDNGTVWSTVFAGACLGISLYRTIVAIVGRLL